MTFLPPMLLSVGLLAFSGIFLVVKNCDAGARFGIVQLLLVLYILANVTGQLDGAQTYSIDHFGGCSYGKPKTSLSSTLTAVYSSTATLLHLAIVFGARGLARRSSDGGGKELLWWTSVCTVVLVTLLTLVEASMIYSEDPFNAFFIMPFDLHNVTIPAIDLSMVIVLLYTKREKGVVKRHCDILLACMFLLLYSRGYILARNLLPILPPRSLSSRVVPEVLVVLLVAVFARDFTAMTADQSIAGLLLDYPPSDRQLDFEEKSLGSDRSDPSAKASADEMRSHDWAQQLENAKESLDRFLETNSDDKAATVFMRELDMATFLNRGLQMGDTDARSWHFLGQCLAARHDFPGAYNAYQMAVFCDGKNSAIWYSIGELYEEVNQHQEDALSAYSHAVMLDPSNKQIKHKLELLKFRVDGTNLIHTGQDGSAVAAAMVVEKEGEKEGEKEEDHSF